MKVGAGWRRGLLYTTVAVVWSSIVNIFRIFVLALYALSISGHPGFEAFHSVVGELLFIPWIVGYIYLVVRREKALAKAGAP